MILRLKALRSLRWNYKLRGCWIWLKGRSCSRCFGVGEIWFSRPGGLPGIHACPKCEGAAKRGYQRILSEPQTVLDEQTAAAEGVFV